MGRKRTKDKGLPARVYRKHGAFWFVDKANKWHRLGDNLVEAMAEWARLVERPAEARTMNALFDRYMAEVAPKKAERSYKDNIRQVQKLRLVFGEMAPEDVEPHHVYGYLDARGADAKVQANREKALLSHVFTKAMQWGILRQNPCRGVKRLTEKPRDRYVEDEELAAFMGAAPDLIRAYCLFKYVTGLRQADILSLKREQIKDDGIHVAISKAGGKRRVILWNEDLELAVKEAKALKRPVKSLHLFCNRSGQPYTGSGFRAIWQRAMRKAIEDGVLAERFTDHDIRAKAATDAHTSGQDAQQLLAHANRHTTDVYIRARKVERITPLTRKKPV
jgi:integrase